jgi:predicted acetyltransferase
MPVEIRAITDDEVVAYRDALMTVFGDDGDSDPNGADRMRALLALSRCWAAFDGATIVATAATFDHTMVVPGGDTLAMAGLTMVSVRPTHRRRGFLRELMRLHLDDARARGVAISGLWASEASIYGRFGYGVAAEADLIGIEDAGTIVFTGAGPLDEIDWIDESGARQELPGVYARAVAQRPGALLRSATWWRERRFLETPFARGDASRRRHVLARRGGDIVGYIGFRQRGIWTNGLPAGKVEIDELIGIDARAEATLWRFALRIDLFPTVTWWNAPTDDVLAWRVANPRRIKRTRIDNLWLRIDDVAAALAARRYAADGVLGIAVEDTSWELVIESGRARCTPAARAPALRLSRAALGALYLGATPASRLARAELVHGDAATVATADRVFAWQIAPWCPEQF